MPTGVGYQTISAVGAETVVNTPVNATQRVRNLEFTPDAEFTHLFDESLSGNIAQATPDLGVVDIRGTWRCYLTYTLLHVLLKHFFGSLTAGRYTFEDSLIGTGLTWAIDKQVGVWELSGVKINSMVLTIGAGVAELSGTLIAQGITYTGGQNTSAELLALLPNVDRRCKLAPDLSVRLGVATAALGSPEEITITAGTITLGRPQAETHVSGTRNVMEPAPDNFVTGAYELTLPRYTTNQYHTWRAALTRLSLRLLFDEEAGSHTQEWLLPNVVIGPAPNPVSGPGFVPQSISGPITIGQDTLTAVTISAAAADNSINDSGAGFPMLYPGAKIWIAGFTGTAGNNGVATVVSRTASKIIISGITLVDDAVGESVTIVTRNPFVTITEV